jgi:hypothetical protein
MAKKAGREIFMDDGFSLDASELDEISALLGATGQKLNANKLGGPKTQAPAPAPAAAPAAFGLKKTNATPPKPAKVITKVVVEEKPVTNVKDVKLRSTGSNAGEIQQSAYNPYKQQEPQENEVQRRLRMMGGANANSSVTKETAFAQKYDAKPSHDKEANRQAQLQKVSQRVVRGNSNVSTLGIEQYGVGSITKGPAMVALVDPEPATVPELSRSSLVAAEDKTQDYPEPTNNKCPVCLMPISAGKVAVEGKNYHPKCFDCRRCSKYMKSPYISL